MVGRGADGFSQTLRDGFQLGFRRTDDTLYEPLGLRHGAKIRGGRRGDLSAENGTYRAGPRRHA